MLLSRHGTSHEGNRSTKWTILLCPFLAFRRQKIAKLLNENCWNSQPPRRWCSRTARVGANPNEQVWWKTLTTGSWQPCASASTRWRRGKTGSLMPSFCCCFLGSLLSLVADAYPSILLSSGVKRDEIGALIEYLGTRGYTLFCNGVQLHIHSPSRLNSTVVDLFPTEDKVTWTALLQVLEASGKLYPATALRADNFTHTV